MDGAPNATLGASNATNATLGASNATNATLGASNATNATLGRIPNPGQPAPVTSGPVSAAGHRKRGRAGHAGGGPAWPSSTGRTRRQVPAGVPGRRGGPPAFR